MGLGLSLGNEVGKDGGQSSYTVLENGNFSITAGSGTLQQVGTIPVSKAFAFETSGTAAVQVSTFVTVPEVTSGTLVAEYRYSFDIVDRTGSLASVRSVTSDDSYTFAWGTTLSKANYDIGGTNLYVGGDETVFGNFTEGGSGLFVVKHTQSTWPTSLEFRLSWTGDAATRTLTINNFKVEQYILSTS